VKARVLQAAALLVAIALHAWASAAYAQDAVLLAITVATIPLGGSVPLGKTGLRVLGGVVFVAGGIAGWAHTPDLGYGPGALPRVASFVALGCLFAAVSRSFARASSSPDRAAFVLGLLAVASSGGTRLGPAYAAYAAAYLACGLFALRARDSSQAHASHLGARHRVGFGAVVGLASLIALGFVRSVPPIHHAVQRAFDRAYIPHDIVGFGGGAWLGSMRDVIKSEDEVFRITPPPQSRPIDYLRGGVYDEYRTDGFWDETPFSARLRDVVVGDDLGGDSAVRVRRLSGSANRYFLPLDGRDLHAEAGIVEADELGAIVTFGSSTARTYTFALGDRDALAPVPPGPFDLRIPRAERARITQLAHEWTDAAPTAEAKLDAIQEHLTHEYRYSLEFLREADDPLLDFLFVSKQGYCTYFASAFALLARSANVPTRFVTGYRVAEWSSVAQEYVVRDKNAHSWVEAWVNGAWHTYDATPMQELLQDKPHLSSLATLATDSARRIEHAVTYAIQHATPGQLFAVLGGLLALWGGIRALRKRTGERERARSGERVDPPLPCFERLTSSLARRGVARAPSEPLFRFAARLDDAGLSDAARLVERYAAMRYGGIGEPGAVEADVDRFLGASPASSVPRGNVG
jgi:transglutaminase-like putative cysteine protease